RAARILLQPAQSPSDALSGATLNQPQVAVLELIGSERIVVKVESAGQPPTAVKHKSAYHGSCAVSMLFECLGNRTEPRIERLSGKILHPILKRIRSSQNHGVRWPGQRHL